MTLKTAISIAAGQGFIARNALNARHQGHPPGIAYEFDAMHCC